MGSGQTRSNNICTFLIKMREGSLRLKVEGTVFNLTAVRAEKDCQQKGLCCVRVSCTRLGRTDEVCSFVACGITGGMLSSLFHWLPCF